MPASYNTLAGLIQFNDKNLAELQISDLLDSAPVLAAMTAVLASNGTQHKYLKQTTASSAAFRDALNGTTKTASADTLVTDTLKIIDGSFSTDVALANSYKGGKDAWLQMELARTMKQIMFELEQQLFYGVGNDASGFIGILDGICTAIGDATMTVAASTAGSSVSAQTSVYLIRHGINDAAMVLGNDGRFIVEEEPTVIEKAGSGSGYYPAYYVPVTGYGGFQVGGARSVARICNVETALNDDDLYNALSLFPASMPPNAICMNRKAAKLLRQSRTATNVTGAPAPVPTSLENIPIIITDAIISTEAVET